MTKEQASPHILHCYASQGYPVNQQEKLYYATQEKAYFAEQAKLNFANEKDYIL